MARAAKAKAEPRMLEQVRTDIVAAEASAQKLRRLLDASLSAIRARRFQPWIEEVNARGILVKKRNPEFKNVREYSSTLKAVREHLAALRAEENALMQACADESSPWAAFKPKPVVGQESEE